MTLTWIDGQVNPQGTTDYKILRVSGADGQSSVRITSLMYPAGTEMTFSVWWKANTATTATLDILSETVTGVEIPTTWTRYEKAVVLPSGVVIDITPANGAPDIYLCMAQQEAGSIASDWRPAPEDAENEIGSVSADLTVVAGQVSAHTTAINDLDGRMDTAEAQITPTAIVNTVRSSQYYQGDLSAKANQTDLTDLSGDVADLGDDLGDLADRVSVAESKITDSAIINTVTTSTTYTNDISGLDERLDVAETVIKQTADGVDIVVSSTNVFKGVTQQDETTVEITDSSFIVNTDVVDLQGANNQSLHIDGDGAVMDTLTVNQSLIAPNVVLKYVGSQNITIGDNGMYNSLQGALDQINGKYIANNVIISLLEDRIENVTVEGIFGPGQLVINGNNHTLQGMMYVHGCMSNILIQRCNISCNTVSSSSAQTASYALRVYDSRDVTFNILKIMGPYTGTLDGTLVRIDYASNARFRSVRMDGAATLIYAGNMCNLDCYNLSGTGTNYLVADGARITWSGTRPVGTYSEGMTSLIAPSNPDSLTPNAGESGGGGETPVVVGSATMTATRTASFGNDWDNGTDIMQGYAGRTEYKGCAWFNWTVPSGMVIKTAALTIKRKSSAGRSGTVNVHLWVTPNSTDIINMGTDPMPADSSTYDYGILGTMTPGETATFAGGDVLSVAAQLNMHPTWGIMICTEETAPMSGRDYSANYCRIEGTDGAAPILEVTYTNQDEEG